MSVKRSMSGTRMLLVLEEIARSQPIGVTEISQLIGADKTAVQRSIMTLADAGWIKPAPGTPTRWETSGHIHAVAHWALNGSDLRRRARAELEALRDESGETAALVVPDLDHFIVIDVAESRQMLRVSPPVGMIVSASESATARAVLAHLSADEQVALLGALPGAALARDLVRAAEQGYFVNDDPSFGGSLNFAAPIFESDGRPAATVILSIPPGRVTPKDYPRLGEMLRGAASRLSQGKPRVTVGVSA